MDATEELGCVVACFIACAALVAGLALYALCRGMIR